MKRLVEQFGAGPLFLVENVPLEVEASAFRDFFGMVLGAAEGWDGSDSLRPLAV